MKLCFELNDKNWEADLSKPLPIFIELDFSGQQPNHFGVDRARRKTFEDGGFVGTTEKGGGCNVSVLRLIPHCNGTHTETVGHIVDQDLFVSRAALESMFVAQLITVESTPAKSTSETYEPKLNDNDHVVSRDQIDRVVAEIDFDNVDALVIRTLPNSTGKTSRQYSNEDAFPFFTVEAMERINQFGVRHLLVDTPSIDRMRDDGMLTNHHLFWNVPEKTHELTQATRIDKTITEMIFVPDKIEDGRYLLNLQVAAFCSDAAPSRPILFAVKEKK